MDRLKKILRQALADQAQRIKLQGGAPPEIAGAFGARAMAEPALDDAYVESLFGYLFPTDKAQIAAKQVTRGALNVPNLGKILLIAQPASPPSLRLYVPPAGAALFESDWTKLTSKTVLPDAGGMPPPGMGMFVPPGGGLDADPAGAGAPPMPGFVPPDLGAAPGGMPNLSAPPSGGMPNLSAPPGGGMPNLSAPPSGGMPNLSAPPLGGGLPDLSAPPPGGLAMPSLGAPPLGGGLPDLSAAPPPAALSMPAVTAPPIAAYAPPQQPTYAPQPVAAPPPAAAAPAEGEAPRIRFEADADGESSDGTNPIDPILTDMIKRKASDLHLTCGEPVCMRIDGDIERVGDRPIDPQTMASYLMPIFPRRNQEEFAKINDTDFAYELRGIGRFRVNIFRDKNGVGSVMRHIPSKILTAEQLNLSQAILKFCTLNKGLVLVTGPTGSGKSTTLAAMIDHINKTREDHILTIEDPVEFVHPQQRCLVNQREVHKHTTSFARALKAALREDPDIVLIGEMRDLETIAIAIETAETGHLVFGTLHTTTAVSTIDRIIDQFPSDRQEQIRMMLAGGLRGVVAQTLLKKKGGGRVAAQEILVTSDAVSAMIREGKNHMIQNHMQSQKQDGNVLLNECLGRLVRDGIVDPDEAFKKSVDKGSFIELLKRLGVNVDHLLAPQAAPAKPQSPQQPTPPGRKAG